MLLLIQRVHCSSLGQQQFFGVQRVHASKPSAHVLHFPRHGLAEFDHRHGVLAARVVKETRQLCFGNLASVACGDTDIHTLSKHPGGN